MIWINNLAQLKYYEELIDLTIFGLICAGSLIYLGIICLRSFFKSRKKK